MIDTRTEYENRWEHFNVRKEDGLHHNFKKERLHDSLDEEFFGESTSTFKDDFGAPKKNVQDSFDAACNYVSNCWNQFKDVFIDWISIVPVFVHTLVLPCSFFLMLVHALFYNFTWAGCALYLISIALDSRAYSGIPLNGIQKFVRRSVWWKWFAAYYPITLHKTCDLEPSDPPIRESKTFVDTSFYYLFAWPLILVRNIVQWIFRSETNSQNDSDTPKRPGKRYIFACSPHGIICMGAFCALGTEGCGWSKLFPGITTRVLTLGLCFNAPFYRQYLFLTGCCSVSKKSCINLLNNNQSICIIIGGTRESLMTEPGKFDLILKSRRGVIKVALETGASVVPVLSFGENDVYNADAQGRDSIWYKLNCLLSSSLGFAVPRFIGRGLCDNCAGPLPFSRPINVVVGRPIDLPLSENYTKSDIDKYQNIYISELTKLYEENVDKYTPGVSLRIVE